MRREYDARLTLVGGELPASGLERVVFCFSYASKFDGDNHDEALRFAAFAVYYQKAMKLGPWSEESQERGAL